MKRHTDVFEATTMITKGEGMFSWKFIDSIVQDSSHRESHLIYVKENIKHLIFQYHLVKTFQPLLTAEDIRDGTWHIHKKSSDYIYPTHTDDLAFCMCNNDVLGKSLGTWLYS